MRSWVLTAVLVAFVSSAAADTPDQPKLPKDLQGIGIDQHLNAQTPLDARFTDEAGRAVRLGDYLGRRPAILALVYYRCTMLCSYILNGVVSGIRPLSLKPGRDFDVIAISIDPAEDAHIAAGKRDHYVKSYSSKAGPQGWHFLTGAEKDIRVVADAVGFHYRYDPKSNLFLHASGVMVLTPTGRVARYLYGVEFAPKDLKLGLIEASGNRIGSPTDQILLFCYHYDPVTGKYGAVVINMLRIAAAAFLLALVALLTIYWRRDVRAGHVISREAHYL